MPNILIVISYDGTNYSGFQIQANAPTIQAEIERALAVIYKEPVRIAGAGRTDAGVHAYGQSASFKAPFTIETDQLPSALNSLLPPDIVALKAYEVPESFHARFDAKSKTYSYSIDRAPYSQVLSRLYNWHMPEPINMEKLQRAAKIFEGTYDFKSFQASGARVTDTTRTIYRVDIEENCDNRQLKLYISGSGFLYRMVRMITGTIIRAGKGDLTLSDIETALTSHNSKVMGPTAPAHGLCLEEIIYDIF